MRKNKDKIILLFPHLPNPRMLKRIDALKKDYILEVIYWDRGTAFEKVNQIPSDIDQHVIRRKANEGNPSGRMGVTLKVLKDVLKIIKKSKPQYLYISKTDMLLVGVLYKLLFNKAVKIVYEVSDLHSLVVDKQKNISKKIISTTLIQIERLLCKNIKLLVVTSEYFYQYFYSEFVEKSKCLFIPNTPNSRVFSNFKREKNEKYTIGFIGAVRYAEQLKMLIDAAEVCNVNVFIAGKGIDYNKIRKYAKDKDFVEMYGEYEYEKEIKQLYEKVQCVYSVYDADKRNVKIALPNRLYEAVYTKTPIIAAKNTYLGEVVETNEIGKTVSHTATSELIKAINDLKSNEKLITHIENKASSLSEKWRLEKYNKRLLKILNT